MRPSIISGKPVRSDTGLASTAASTIPVSVLPVAKISYPSRCRPRANPLSPVLSLTDSRALGKSCLHQTNCLGKNSIFGFVDPRAKRLQRIAGQHRHSLLDEDGPRIELASDNMHRRPAHWCGGLQCLLHRVHSTAEVREQRGVHVDDPAAERLEKWPGVDAVVVRVDDQLHAVDFEEVAHCGVAILGRGEGLLRKLTERNSSLACKFGASTGRAVGGDSYHLEASVDKVSQVRSSAGNGDPQSHRGTRKIADVVG